MCGPNDAFIVEFYWFQLICHIHWTVICCHLRHYAPLQTQWYSTKGRKGKHFHDWKRKFMIYFCNQNIFHSFLRHKRTLARMLLTFYSISCSLDVAQQTKMYLSINISIEKYEFNFGWRRWRTFFSIFLPIFFHSLCSHPECLSLLSDAVSFLVAVVKSISQTLCFILASLLYFSVSFLIEHKRNMYITNTMCACM